MRCNNCDEVLDNEVLEGTVFHTEDGVGWCSVFCWETDNSEAWVPMALTDWKE